MKQSLESAVSNSLKKIPVLLKESQRMLKEKLRQETTQASFSMLFRFAKAQDYIFMSLGIISTSIFSSLPLVFIIKIGDIVESISNYKNESENFYEEQKEIAMLLIGLGTLTVFMSWLSIVSFMKLGMSQGTYWKNGYFGAVINRPIKWFEKYKIKEISKSIDQDCNLIELAVGEKLMFFISSIISFIGSWVLAFYTNLQLSGIGLCVIPIQLVVSYIVTIYKTSNLKNPDSYSKDNHAQNIAEESFNGIKTIVSHNSQEIIARAYQSKLITFPKSCSFYAGFPLLAYPFVIIFGFSAVLFYATQCVIINTRENIVNGSPIEAKQIVIVFLSVAMSVFNLGIGTSCFYQIKTGISAAANANLIIKTMKRYDGPKRATSINGMIEFTDVRFYYPSKKNIEVLKGINFNVNPGETLAIVGKNNSGKSTIIQLIEGYYQCTSGKISIDGTDIKDYNLSDLREFIGLVTHKPILFNTSILENIKIGSKFKSDNDIHTAAIKVGAEEFINVLPEKYETYIGPNGAQLSSEHKQQISIARAVVKNPKIFLIDKATSELDPKAAHRVQKILDKVIKGTTTIIIPHRLSTIKNVDKIILIESGKIADIGTYEQLSKSKGIFQWLLMTQKKIDSDTEKSLKSLVSIGVPLEQQVIPIEPSSPGKVLRRILIGLRKYWVWLILVSITSLISGATFPVFGLFFSKSISFILKIQNTDNPEYIRETIIYMLITTTVCLFSLTILNVSLIRIKSLYSYDLRLQVFKSLLFYEQKFYDKPENSIKDLIFNLNTGCENIANVGSPILALKLLILSSTGMCISIMMQYNMVLSLIILALLPFAVLFHVKSEILRVSGFASYNLQDTSDLIKEALTDIKTIHSINRQDYYHDLYMAKVAKENKATSQSANINGIVFGVKVLLFYSMIALVIWYGAYQIQKTSLNIDDMLVFIFCILFSFWNFIILRSLTPDVKAGIISGKELYRIMDYELKPAKTGSFESIYGSYELKDVIFKYDNSLVILKSISFKLDCGKSLGVVGSPLSGKSTLALLLSRFYEATSGEILIDGRPISHYNLRHLRESICWVGKDPVLFKGTLLVNMKLARSGLGIQEALNALEKAQASDVIQLYGLENDLEIYEEKLTLGQKQKIAIARTLTRRPKVLILDESIHALDVGTQLKIMNEIRQEKLTLIAVSARADTVKGLDEILVIEQGSIVERGSYEELITIPNGCYKKLYQASD